MKVPAIRTASPKESSLRSAFVGTGVFDGVGDWVTVAVDVSLGVLVGVSVGVGSGVSLGVGPGVCRFLATAKSPSWAEYPQTVADATGELSESVMSIQPAPPNDRGYPPCSDSRMCPLHR